MEEPEQCYQAVQSRDARFDGQFVTAVRTTGIYCRPSCPAQTPKRENIEFYRVPAAAQAAGFRACKRCHPDASPGSPEWNVRGDLVGRALGLISEGVVDLAGVNGLAARLAVSERHLNRELVTAVGASPLALARARRAQTAAMLVESTGLPLTEIAFAAGYGSVRQFNDGIKSAFGCTPSELRKAKPPDGVTGGRAQVALRLPFRPPFYADGILNWLKVRAISGVEEMAGETYRRAVHLARSVAVIEVSVHSEHLQLRLIAEDLSDIGEAVQKTRQLFDIDADPDVVDSTLSRDALLAPLIAQHPGTRVPSCVDGFEMACRAILGQQISVAGARVRATRLAQGWGQPLPAADGTVVRCFPTAHDLSAATPADIATVGLTKTRAGTLYELATMVASGDLTLDRGADRAEIREKLLGIKGIGPWTATYIGLRSLGDPDAFPASDLGLVRSAALLGGPSDPDSLEARAQKWRPWRAYGAMHLWNYTPAIPQNAPTPKQ